MTITNELLLKSLNALKEANLEKSLHFFIKGSKIKEGLVRKIAECQAKITVLKEAIPSKSLKESAEYVTTEESAAENPNKWRIESLERRIKDYETIQKYLEDKRTYELDKWELTEYGL